MDKRKNSRNILIGDVLKEYGYLDDRQIAQALEYQKSHRGVRLGEALIAMGFITERQMLQALADRLDLAIGEPGQIQAELDAVEMIPAGMAEKYRMLAVEGDGDTLTILTSDPLNFYGIEEVRQITGMNLKLLLCEGPELERAIHRSYSELMARKAAWSANDAGQAQTGVGTDTEEEDAPVVDLLNSLIRRAFHSNASDIHVEPFENKTMVRMRIDGALMEYLTLQPGLHAPLTARIKILGGMDIAERRIPQDGHFRNVVDGQTVNMRVSAIPTIYGEKVVIRLLRGPEEIDRPETFGMNQEDYEKLGRMLHAPNGLIYITGPTGSGKTTTLYMILEELAKRQVNISTIEDPVEWNLEKIIQCQVNTKAGLTFETGLRALLRQDPDIIMVGETRDRETAEISVRGAVTGHLVLSTLHTNDALSAIVRLKDMGIEPYLTASSLLGVVAQRLVRKLCPVCAREVEADEPAKTYLGGKAVRIKIPVGCRACNNTGYSGRIAVHEVVYMDQVMRQMTASGAGLEQLRTYAVREQGMKTLRDRTSQLVRDGVTSMEELLRAVYYA